MQDIMPDLPSFAEKLISRILALRLLMALGYEYLTPEQALRLRGGKASNVVLEGVLEVWLRENNEITHKGQTFPFAHANIMQAILGARRSASAGSPFSGGLRPGRHCGARGKSGQAGAAGWLRPPGRCFGPRLDPPRGRGRG